MAKPIYANDPIRELVATCPDLWLLRGSPQF